MICRGSAAGAMLSPTVQHWQRLQHQVPVALRNQPHSRAESFRDLFRILQGEIECIKARFAYVTKPPGV